MFRKKIRFGQDSLVNFAIIALVIAVVFSIFFGLILKLPTWYAYTLRCMIFAPLGYVFGKGEYEDGEKISSNKEKVWANIVYIICFTLVFLFVMGFVFAVNDLAMLTLSSMLPFSIAFFLSTDWKKHDENPVDHADECPYEIEPEQKDEE